METLSLKDLCRNIRLAGPAAEQVLSLAQTLDWNALAPAMTMMSTPGRWQEGLDALKAALDPDPLGMKMLTCCLQQALNIRPRCQALGLSEEIFTETMACFSRFVDEHMESFGAYGFDRSFWTVRQLSAVLFRIGELEYELVDTPEEKQVHLHIPSGAHLCNTQLRPSWVEAKALLRRSFPDYADAPMLCESWLLSPTLQSLLPDTSNILRFQQAFRIHPLGLGNDYLQWVFKRTDLPTDQLPENTGLQRRLKAHILAGGTWEEAEGVLLDDPFLPA